jgi:hypothetical protein
LLYFCKYKIIFFFHCKGGGTTFKYYLLNEFLKKQYKNINFEDELKKINIHDLIRKYKSKDFLIEGIHSEMSIINIKKKYKNYKYIYIHRNYKERLVSCFYNKFVNLDDNGYFFFKINLDKINYNEFKFEDFINNIIKKNIKDLHWSNYPKNFNNLKLEIINLKNLSAINNILKENNMPLFNIEKKNVTNSKLEKVLEVKKEITIGYILELRKKGYYIPYNLFYNDYINNLLKNNFGHEIIL